MSVLLDVWASGIDFSLPGNGGPNCLAHSSSSFRVAETLLASLTSFWSAWVGFRNHTPPANGATCWASSSKLLRRILLWVVLLTYLAEVMYKVLTYQFVFVLNPCHLLCLVHLYLLSDLHANSKVKLYVFRIHLFYLHGPLMAVLFPVTNTLFLPGEVTVYWLEHVSLLLVPIFLLRQYPMPASKDLWNWLFMAYGFWGAYHYLLLQPVALLSLGNLNSILCPAITDPFRGPYYRLHAIWHQWIACLLSGFFWRQVYKREDGEQSVNGVSD